MEAMQEAQHEFEEEYKGRSVIFGDNQKGKVIGFIKEDFVYDGLLPWSKDDRWSVLRKLKIEHDGSVYAIKPDKIIAVSDKIETCEHCGKRLQRKN